MVSAYSNSPLWDLGGHRNEQCLGFRRQSLCRTCYNPLFLDEGMVCPFLWWLGPAREGSIGTMVTYSACLRGRRKLCPSPMYGLTWTAVQAQPETMVDGTTSWHSPSLADLNPFPWTNTWELCWVGHMHTFWPPGILRPHSLIWVSLPFHQWAPFRQGSLLRSRCLKVHILSFRALSLSCSWLTYAHSFSLLSLYSLSLIFIFPPPLCPLSFDISLLFYFSYSTMHVFQLFICRVSRYCLHLSLNSRCSGWLDSYVTKFRRPPDMRNSTPKSYIHLKLVFLMGLTQSDSGGWSMKSFTQGIHLFWNKVSFISDFPN